VIATPMHRNAPLPLEGRRRLVERCQTRAIAHVAAEMAISRVSDRCRAIDDSESATMASALIFLHLELLAIDRTLAHWVSPNATAVETLCVTRWGPPTVGYVLPPTGVALSSAIMSISTHAPNGTCATLTALRAWMPRSPNTWTSSSDAPSATR
jgi:hypothetical protein